MPGANVPDNAYVSNRAVAVAFGHVSALSRLPETARLDEHLRDILDRLDMGVSFSMRVRWLDTFPYPSEEWESLAVASLAFKEPYESSDDTRLVWPQF